MKKFLTMMLTTATLLLAEVAWQPDFKTAQAEAKKSGKPIMALLVSHTCHWCRKLENRTLQNPAVSDYINEHFVAVLLYREDGGFPDTIHSSMVPTTFFLTPEGQNIVKPSVGYWEPSDYMSDLKLALRKFKDRVARP